jgi:ferrochelatase
LLVNLGSPASPSIDDVHNYLKEFLSDPAVIQIPKATWWSILNGIILPIRAPKSAKMYQRVWTSKGSPLVATGEEIAHELQIKVGPTYKIVSAMRYGSPSLKNKIKELADHGCREIFCLSFFPQFSLTTMGSVMTKVKEITAQYTPNPSVCFLKNYSKNVLYIKALKEKIQSEGGIAADETLLVSFHGIPISYVLKGDKYQQYCEETFQELAKALSINKDQICITYQSRFGNEEWLKPYTDTTIIELAGQKKKVVVVCPGFPVDCLETLDEINVELRHLYNENGGISFRYIPCLNKDPIWLDALAQFILTRPAQLEFESL